MVVNKSVLYIKGESLEPGVVLLDRGVWEAKEFVVVKVEPYQEFLEERDWGKSLVTFEIIGGDTVQRIVHSDRFYRARATLDNQSL